MKSYKQFINESKTDIDSICKEYGIRNYTINSDGSIDVNGDVFITSFKLNTLPPKFRNVTGYFICAEIQLTSLEGCPISVGGDFICNSNRLTSLKGCPKIGNDFDCSNNRLISLENCPINVRNFDCSDNQLTSLKGLENITGNLWCDKNKLTSLEGCPESIGGDFSCRHNQITDFKGISEFFEGRFSCNGNPIHEIYDLFRVGIHRRGNVKCIKWINEYDVIQDGNKVIMDRLEEVFHQLGMHIPQKIEFKHYEII